MKRSDIIQDIASEIIMSGFGVSYNQAIDVPYDRAQDMAEAILARIEKEGMYPARYVGVFATGKLYDKELDQGRDVHMFYDWEPEDSNDK